MITIILDVKTTVWERITIDTDFSKKEVDELVKKCNSFEEIKDEFNIDERETLRNTKEFMDKSENENRATVEYMEWTERGHVARSTNGK